MKKKGFSLLVALLLTTVALAGCGEKEASASKQDTKEEISTSADNEKDSDISSESEKEEVKDNSDKEEKDSGLDLFAPKIAPVAEEDAFVNIGGVEVKMDQTWEEFQQLMSDNNWTFVDSEDSFPNENKLNGYGYINTNCGKIKFYFMEGKDGITSELECIIFDPVDLTDENVSITGIDIYTKYEDVEDKLQLHHETVIANVEYARVYYLDDYLTVAIEPLTVGDTAIITVTRTMYSKR